LLNAPATVNAAKLLGYQNFWLEDGRTCCIRAEDIRIGAGRAAVITGVREQGADLRLTCMTHAPVTVLIKAGEKTAFTVGQKIQLHFSKDKVKVLNG
jgi:spore coat protein U-like protein